MPAGGEFETLESDGSMTRPLLETWLAQTTFVWGGGVGARGSFHSRASFEEVGSAAPPVVGTLVFVSFTCTRQREKTPCPVRTNQNTGLSAGTRSSSRRTSITASARSSVASGPSHPFPRTHDPPRFPRHAHTRAHAHTRTHAHAHMHTHVHIAYVMRGARASFTRGASQLLRTSYESSPYARRRLPPHAHPRVLVR